MSTLGFDNYAGFNGEQPLTGSDYANELYIGGYASRYSVDRKRGPPGEFFKGSIDDLKIYTDALPDNTIRALASQIPSLESVNRRLSTVNSKSSSYPTAGLQPYEGRIVIQTDDVKGGQTDNFDVEHMQQEGNFRVKEAYTIDGKKFTNGRSGWLRLFSPKNGVDLTTVPKINGCTTHGTPTLQGTRAVPKLCPDGLPAIADIQVQENIPAYCTTGGPSASFKDTNTTLVLGTISLCGDNTVYKVVAENEKCGDDSTAILLYKDFSANAQYQKLCMKVDKKPIFSYFLNNYDGGQTLGTILPGRSRWFYTDDFTEKVHDVNAVYQLIMGLVSTKQNSLTQESIKRYISSDVNNLAHYYSASTDAYGSATKRESSTLVKEGNIGYVSVNKYDAKIGGLVPFYSFERKDQNGFEDNFYTTVPEKDKHILSQE